MTYTAPDANAVDFELNSYAPPKGGEVDFSLGLRLQAPLVELSLGVKEPAASGTGETSMQADGPVELSLGAEEPAASGSGTVTMQADRPVDLSLGVGTPIARAVARLEAPLVELDMEAAEPKLAGSGTATMQTDGPVEATIAAREPGVGGVGTATLSADVVEVSVDPILPGFGQRLKAPLIEAGLTIPEPGWAVDSWIIDGELVGTIVDETRTWDSLTLTFQSGSALVVETFRALDEHAGKVEVIERSGGDFRAIDRRGGSNTYSLQPPKGRQPPRLGGEFLVDEYTESLTDQRGERYDVTISFVPERSRETNSGLSETADAGEWEFDFHTGAIATRRVYADPNVSASKGTKSRSLRLILTDEQVQVLEESASKLAAVRVRDVPDGQNLAEDRSPESRNTVTVDSPDDDVVESGEYVVQEWETAMDNDEFHEVSLTLIAT